MNQDSELPLASLRVDGGMTANKLLLQLQADLLGIPVGGLAFYGRGAVGSRGVYQWGRGEQGCVAGGPWGAGVWNMSAYSTLSCKMFCLVIFQLFRRVFFGCVKGSCI